MNITVRRITLACFMSHTSSVLNLPNVGLVTVSGENGVGKSTLLEAVSYALWGKTLRDASPWREGVVGSVAVVLKGIYIERSISKHGIKKLVWCIDGNSEPASFGTITKSQEALERVIGTWEMWRRTHVLSSQDVASFSVATNAEKCRLLESMLGLARFDKAREIAAKDLASDTTNVATMAAKLRAAESSASVCTSLIAEHHKGLADLAALPSVLAPSEVLFDQYEELVLCLSEQESRLLGSISDCKMSMSLRSDALLRASAGKCSLCNTPFAHTEEHIASLGADVREAKAAISEQEGELLAVRKDRGEARLTLNRLYQEREQHKASAGAHAMKQRLQQSLASDTIRLLDAQDEYAVCNTTLYKLQIAQEAGKLAVKALSVGGARSHILHQAIRHVEVSANAWMSRLNHNIAITVSPYTEGASGATRNDIAIGVVGAGGEGGYSGCSGGERRLVDTVLMLALGEAAAAASGATVGTLWLDEIGESLDAGRFASMESLIAELAETRVCVFISHTHTLSGVKNYILTKTPEGARLE